jgi:hypothetical protein
MNISESIKNIGKIQQRIIKNNLLLPPGVQIGDRQGPALSPKSSQKYGTKWPYRSLIDYYLQTPSIVDEGKNMELV